MKLIIQAVGIRKDTYEFYPIPYIYYLFVKAPLYCNGNIIGHAYKRFFHPKYLSLYRDFKPLTQI